jgi:carbonic anhydrase
MRRKRRPNIFAAALIAVVALAAAPSARGAGPAARSDEPAAVLQQLLDGNQRFAASKPEHPNQSPQRRAEIAKGQHPVAVVLACSDSRSAPEIVFDRGLGDLFIVRVAGNIADEPGIESIGFAVHHRGARLVMVLGHTKCGAVTSAVKGGARDEMPAIMAAIEPAAAAVKGKPGDPIENAVRENVRLVVAKLKREPALASMIKSGQIKVVGAVYDLDTGKVTMVED